MSYTTNDESNLNLPHDFATTHWSIVLAAGKRSSPDSGRALESLCVSYWYPLYAFARRRVSDGAEAQDLTQAFFAELLEKNYVGSATPRRGRFRAYLLTAFKHFLSKQWNKAKAKKRGGGKRPLPLDFESADARLLVEPCGGLTAEQLYDREWAITLLETVMGLLQSEFRAAGKSNDFEQLKGFIIGDHERTTYAAVAAELETSEPAVKMAAARMRARYRELLRQEILRTVSAPGEVEDEIRSLFTTLGS